MELHQGKVHIPESGFSEFRQQESHQVILHTFSVSLDNVIANFSGVSKAELSKKWSRQSTVDDQSHESDTACQPKELTCKGSARVARQRILIDFGIERNGKGDTDSTAQSSKAQKEHFFPVTLETNFAEYRVERECDGESNNRHEKVEQHEIAPVCSTEGFSAALVVVGDDGPPNNAAKSKKDGVEQVFGERPELLHHGLIVDHTAREGTCHNAANDDSNHTTRFANDLGNCKVEEREAI